MLYFTTIVQQPVSIYDISIERGQFMNNKCNALLILLTAIAALSLIIITSIDAAEVTGEQLFNQHCSMCHPDGGNVMNPAKTLSKKDLIKNNIRTSAEIIKIIRQPGSGMTAFDIKTLSDADASKIAKHILKKYNK